MEKKSAIRLFSRQIHLDNGEVAPGTITCVEGEPLVIEWGERKNVDIDLPDTARVALGRFDPHVHFREAPIPTAEEVEAHGAKGASYESIVETIQKANALYSIRSGSLAALKGGVSAVGAMGNTAWGPVGPYRHAQNQRHYDEKALVSITVWPRMEPDARPVAGHEGKDFGSTFGGSGLTGVARREMFALWKGEAVSYHNDQPRDSETISEFKERTQPDLRLLHHQYFNGDTVLACQRETMEIAQAAGVTSLLARHIPTGPALQQILDARASVSYALPAEVGLDYFYWCQERLLKQKEELALLNYRRPAHPTREDQLSLIELTRNTVRSGDGSIFFGTDHAPHPKAAKAFRNGLPGAPGTRNIEHSLQYYAELVQRYGYSWHDIDLLASINPAKHMARFRKFPFEVGTMASGAMANLTVFDPTAAYAVDEAKLALELEDPEYHSVMTVEKGLMGRTLFTVVNGKVWDTINAPKSLN